MNHGLYSRIGHRIYWTLLLAVYGLTATGCFAQACYSTPDAAINAIRPDSSLSPTSDGRGYRVTNLQSDPVLGHRWATIISCDHPDWPVHSLQIHWPERLLVSSGKEKTYADSPRAVPVVHVGDIVRLWKQENLLRIDAAGISEENGSPGKTIRIRLLDRDIDSQSSQKQLFGIIRGPSDVEMQP
jgi:hypothetical protein